MCTLYVSCILQVGGTSYGVSAVQEEESRKRWMKRYWAYRKEQGFAAEVGGQVGGGEKRKRQGEG